MKNFLFLLCSLLLLPLGRALETTALAQPRASADEQAPPSLESNGLYYISSVPSDPEVRTDRGSLLRIGGKADIQILKAYVSPQDNANTDFSVILDTSGYAVDPKTMAISKPVVLRIGEHCYESSGGGGKTGGPFNMIEFHIDGCDEAQAAAKWLSVDCPLRSPPGYKLFPQFVPAKPFIYYASNEPAIVKFELKNLDDRTVAFTRGGSQRGARDNQYGFRAMFFDSKTVPDFGDPVNFGGFCTGVQLKPGEVFEDKIDLKKWFAFDKRGSYYIHGFYSLTFHQPSAKPEYDRPPTVSWHDYASADFVVEVK